VRQEVRGEARERHVLQVVVPVEGCTCAEGGVVKKGSKHSAASRARTSASVRETLERKKVGLPPEVRHGSVSAYCNSKCRCDECRAGWARYISFFRSERDVQESLQPVHDWRAS
jgi:hypothetical protein